MLAKVDGSVQGFCSLTTHRLIFFKLSIILGVYCITFKVAANMISVSVNMTTHCDTVKVRTTLQHYDVLCPLRDALLSVLIIMLYDVVYFLAGTTL